MKTRLKKLRGELNLTQKMFAIQLGVKYQTVGGYENGNNIPESIIVAICKTYNVNRKWLETGEGDIFEPQTPPEIAPFDYAKLQGCGDLIASIFARYCRFSDDDKARFSELLKRLIDDPDSVKTQKTGEQ